jgi:heat shock protein HslJ
MFRRATLLALLLCGCAAAPTTPASGGLQAYAWNLSSAFDARGQAQQGWLLPGRAPPQLSFQADRLNVGNLCNVIGAGYATDHGALKVTQPISTMRACPEADLMALERRISTQLPQASRYEIRNAPGTAGPTLVMQFSDGSRWELAGTPTPATRFGSPGERVFLEVAPADVPCPSGGGRTCLSVRDVRFDEQGIRRSTGEWHAFEGEIEGFRHEPGTRNVLRLQRYPTSAGAAYVLDMVVESERVR